MQQTLALVCWLPVEEPDLTVGPVLFAEPRVLAVAAGHELTRRTSASLETLAGFQHCDAPSRPDYWADGFIPPQTRSGRRIERGPLVRSTEEILTLTSTGEAVSLFPAHMTRYWNRPDIAYLPVRDLDTLPYALVWRTETENDLIRALPRPSRRRHRHPRRLTLKVDAGRGCRVICRGRR